MSSVLAHTQQYGTGRENVRCRRGYTRGRGYVRGRECAAQRTAHCNYTRIFLQYIDVLMDPYSTLSNSRLPIRTLPYCTLPISTLPYPTLVPYLLTLPLQVKKTPHNPKASLTNNESIPQALPSGPQGDGRLALPSKLAKTIGSVRRPIRKWKTRRNGFDDVQGD